MAEVAANREGTGASDQRRAVTSLALRLLLFLLLALPVLWTGFSATAEKRYETANGFGGQILAGGSLGQTFLARYDGLSSLEVRLGTYGRQADPARATLVMHLRSGPDSPVDIATVTLPPATVLEENGWYRFSFPTISESRGRTFYAQIDSPDGTPNNSLTLAWYKPAPVGDAYAQGKAYRNGKPTGADIAFGLGYSASPLQAFGVMLSAAAASTSPFLVAVLLLAAFAGTLWLVGWLPSILSDPGRRRRWLLRWALPIALGASLVNGLLYMLIVPAWQGPDEYSHFAYAALLDRHNLDDREVEALDLYGKDQDNMLIEAVNSSADRQEFTRRVGGSTNPGAPTKTGPGLFQQVRQPATYYWLVALGMRTARALGAPTDPYANPEAALLAARGVSLLLGLVVVVLAWVTGILLSHEGEPWLRFLLPATVGLLPMHTFIAGVINNDILAEVAVSALFASLAALLRWPRGPRGAILALLSIGIAASSVATKSTAVAAALPLLAGGLLVWVGVLVIGRESSGRHPVRRSRGRLAIVAVLLGLVPAAALVLAFEPEKQSAKGWFTLYDPNTYAPRVADNTAHEGSYVIELGGANAGTAFQELLPPLLHPLLNFSFSGWARVAEGQTVTPKSVRVGLSVVEGSNEVGLDRVLLDPADGWVHLTAAGQISAGAERVRLQIGSSGESARVQFDDMSLFVEGANGPWRDPIFTPVLLDPSGESPPIVLRAPISKILPRDIRAMSEVLVNSQPFSKLALWREYGTAQYTSFWSGFGWLAIFLPPFFYLLFTLLILAALAGLAIRAIRHRQISRYKGLGAATLLTLGAAIITGFAKQMSLLAYGGLPSTPQGRYLFVLTIPIMWLLLVGLSEIRRLLAGRIISVTAQPVVERAASYVPQLAWITALVFLSAYSLLGLILPYYFG